MFVPAGRYVCDPSWRIVEADELACRLLKQPLVGLKCVAAAPRAFVLPHHAGVPAVLPCSRCRALGLADGTRRTFFLHYEASEGSRVSVGLEPIDWTLGVFDQLGAPGFIFTDEDGLIVHHNASLSRSLGVPQTIIGEHVGTWAERLAVRPAAVAGVFRMPAEGSQGPETLRIRDGAGRERDLCVQGNGWYHRGLRCGTIWFFLDATEAAEARQQETLAIAYRLGAVFDHEFRNPLQTIQAAADVIRQELSADRRQVLDLLDAQVRLISEFIGKLRWDPPPGALSVGHLSEAVCASIARASGQPSTRRLAFRHRQLRSEPPVRLHMPSLERVFAHLFENSARARPDATIRVRYKAAGGMLSCTVADNGPGLPDHVLARSLTPRIRDAAIHLGLPIIASTVEAHGGAVTLFNGPEGGASVVIRLPVAPVVRLGTAAVARAAVRG